MKRLLVLICVQLYKLNTPVLRRVLRALVARLEGGQPFSMTLRKLVEVYHGFHIGIGTYGPCFSPEQTWTGHGNLEVGKYSSLASGVCLYSRNHPYWFASTCPLFYNASFTNRGRGSLVIQCPMVNSPLEMMYGSVSTQPCFHPSGASATVLSSVLAAL